MNRTRPDLFIGFLIALLISIVSFFIVTLIFNKVFMDYRTYMEFLKMSFEPQRFQLLLSLCALPNLPAFFFFIRRKQTRIAQGIIMETLIIAALVIYFKFLA